MLRSLPVEDPPALVQVRLNANGDDELSTPLWEEIRDNQKAFSGVLAYSSDRFNLAEAGESHYSQRLWVSRNFFRVLGVPAMLGRTWTPADDMWGGIDANAPAPLVIASLTLAIAAATPAWISAMQASRLDPMAALRRE